MFTISCQFAIVQKTAIHSQNGTPIIYHGWLNIMEQHLQAIKFDIEQANEKHGRYRENIMIPTIKTIKLSNKRVKLTRRMIKAQDDCFEWQ